MSYVSEKEYSCGCKVKLTAVEAGNGFMNISSERWMCPVHLAAPDLLAALIGMVDHYTQLINSGDAGNWDPETDAPVIAARKAMAKAQL